MRGRGLLVCVDLVEPDGSGKSLDPKTVAQLDRKAWDRGAIVYARGNVLRLAPPLCITAAEVDELVGRGGGQRERSGPRPQQRRGSVTVSDTAPVAGS